MPQSVADLVAWLAGIKGIDGLTVTGGEPLDQITPVTELARGAKGLGLTVLLLTGYTWEQAGNRDGFDLLQQVLDVVIAGPYRLSQRIARGLIGSVNQTVHLLSNRYSREDLAAVPSTEIGISPEGDMALTGIDPLDYPLGVSAQVEPPNLKEVPLLGRGDFLFHPG